MKDYEKLLLGNKEWSDEKQRVDPEFFSRLSHLQSPSFLWIGCSDSRVPANEITGTDPGEIFVHRNIANMVVHTDLNLLSVLQYAVQVLEVKHIIVCGHYGCGGVKAALSHLDYGIINKWLRNIKDVYRLHENEIKLLKTEDEQLDRMTELNIIEQVNNLTKTSIIQSAWKHKNRPTIHGWVYSLEDGIIQTLTKVDPNTPLDPIYQYSNL